MLDKVDVEEKLVQMSLSLYSCAMLVDFILYCVVLDHLESELVSLPCVMTMHEVVKFEFDCVSIQKILISSYLVSDYLTMITHLDGYLKVVSVCSQSLKRS